MNNNDFTVESAVENVDAESDAEEISEIYERQSRRYLKNIDAENEV